MNGAASSPIRVKALLVVFGVVVALAMLLGMLIGAGGSSGTDGAVQEVSSDSQYSDSQYSDGGSSDSQFYESGSIVRGDDGEYIYSDDNGNSVSFGG
jgi:hypothetical protein